MTLRDALAELRDKGLVVTRRGRGGGSFVRTAPEGLHRLAAERHAELSVTDLRELGDVHAAVAGTAARLAADRASATEIERLRDLAKRMRDAEDEPSLRRLDGRGLAIGVDADGEMLEIARRRLEAEAAALPPTPYRLIHGNFSQAADILRQAGVEALDGALMDLGFNSMQLRPERGLSHQTDGPLDFRFDQSQGLTAAEWLNEAAEEEIAAVIRDLWRVQQPLCSRLCRRCGTRESLQLQYDASTHR